MSNNQLADAPQEVTSEFLINCINEFVQANFDSDFTNNDLLKFIKDTKGVAPYEVYLAVTNNKELKAILSIFDELVTSKYKNSVLNLCYDLLYDYHSCEDTTQKTQLIRVAVASVNALSSTTDKDFSVTVRNDDGVSLQEFSTKELINKLYSSVDN